MDNSRNPLKVALHGMDARSSKMMAMYLHGPCKGVAIVVTDDNAEVDIFDADSISGQKLLQDQLNKADRRPVIALSLNPINFENVIAIKKPVKTNDMMAALAKAKTLVGNANSPSSPALKPSTGANANVQVGKAQTLDQAHDGRQENKPKTAAAGEKPVLKEFVLNTDEQKKTSKHQAAMQLSEKGFGAFIGNVPGLDVNDPKQFYLANYNPKDYFQGYVDSAFVMCRSQGRESQLNTGWIPLVIYAKSHEVWLEADDNQLRSFSGLAINPALGKKIAVTPLSRELAKQEKALEKYQSMDAFLWKIACWASKGRYPESIDITRPVYLKHWPNFTRLLVTPHAMRIAALLIQGPRTLPDIAQSLNIKPQYVFVFISAAYALGLAGQVKREVDVLISPPEVKPSKNKGILGRILSKLIGNKAS